MLKFDQYWYKFKIFFYKLLRYVSFIGLLLFSALIPLRLLGEKFYIENYINESIANKLILITLCLFPISLLSLILLKIFLKSNFSIKNLLKPIFLVTVVLYSFSTFFKTIYPEPKESLIDPNKSSIVCSRATPYSKPAEFDRALSLMVQRYNQKGSYLAKERHKDLIKIINCLDINYSNLDELGAEGVFYFDKSVSSLDKLVIKVDSKYSFTDDITTAFLLSHELTHAIQLVEEIKDNKRISCVDSEVEAFYELYLTPEFGPHSKIVRYAKKYQTSA